MGKSSVLQATAEIPFPWKGNLCTRNESRERPLFILGDSIVCAAGSGMDPCSENPGEIYRLFRYMNDLRDHLSAEADGMHP